MFCSTIIPTVGRNSLERAIQSVLDQDFHQDNYEIIIVNDSGVAIPEREWIYSPLVRVVNTNHRERCVARNVGAALSLGKYLHFLDDDDWLLPNALKVFWKLAQEYNDCAWLYGGTSLYNRDDDLVINLIHKLQPNCFTQVMAGEWIPLQASLIKHDNFHEIGGFNPLIPGIEDMDLARRMALHFDFRGTDVLVAGVGMGVDGSTTNQEKSRLAGQQARELILNQPGVFSRLSASATNAYWRGRVARVFLTSSIWNLFHAMIFSSLSRIIYSLMAILTSVIPYFFSKEYWRALTRPHQSEAFARGFSKQ